MAVQTPTVNREFALGPAKLVGAQPLSHHPSSPRFTTFWRVGTAIHNFYGRDSQLGTLDSQLGSQLLAGKWHEWRSLNRDRHSHGAILSYNIRTYPFLPRPSRLFVNKMVSSCVLYMPC
jgi:hypothetical protein